MSGCKIFKVVRVENLAGSPFTLVRRVVDLGRVPLALVLRVGLERSLPLATARSSATGRVGDSRRDPVTVFLIVPLLGLLSIRIGDSEGLVHEPPLGHLSLGVKNLIGGVLVPVGGLKGMLEKTCRLITKP